MPTTYINPLADFGFRKLFGEEPNKELLVSFLNTLLPEHHQIADLQYVDRKHQGYSAFDPNAELVYLPLHLAELTKVPRKLNQADLPLETIQQLRQKQ